MMCLLLHQTGRVFPNTVTRLQFQVFAIAANKSHI